MNDEHRLSGGPFAALASPNYRLFYVAFMVGTVGTQLLFAATLWQMYELTNSALQVGLLGLCRAIPQIALAIFGGMLADALDRRKLLMAVQIGTCSISIGLTVLTVLRLVAPHTLLVAAGLFAVGTAVETPTRQAVVPNLVPAKDLGPAVALNNTQRNVALIVGPSLAGVALAFVDDADHPSIDVFGNA